MKKKELKRKLAELEKRVEELEARPAVWYTPTTWPTVPDPVQPPLWPPVGPTWTVSSYAGAQ